MIDDALRVFKTEGYLASASRFHNFDYALDELTRNYLKALKWRYINLINET